ncbi:MAG: flagellar biosynthesis protein FlhB [Methylococcaceae bacterium]|nr:flagellar biosynthesis protein FlhB [Methylococcaceae bacterium]
MAMSEDSGQDKTEEPTGKRLADSRKKGQIARSRELNTLIMLIFSATLLLMWGAKMGESLLKIMHTNFALSREAIFDPATLMASLKSALLDGFLLIAPLVGGLCVAAFLGPLALGGWNFSWDAIALNFGKLNPITGLPRLFGPKGLIELFKALLKMTLILIVAYILFRGYLPEFVDLNHEPVQIAIIHTVKIMSEAFLYLSSALLLVAMLDVPYQLWTHNEQLKMTKQEVRDEAKESDGNPEVKGRIRRLQMEAAQGRMMAEVPNADVIVTNPTHFAVALKYDPETSAARRVVAKGADLIAQQIRQLATEANVPLLASPPLARALYYATELDQEIPKGLFLAVAQVLAYIFSLKTAKAHGQQTPTPPKNIVIPDEFKID